MSLLSLNIRVYKKDLLINSVIPDHFLSVIRWYFGVAIEIMSVMILFQPSLLGGEYEVFQWVGVLSHCVIYKAVYVRNVYNGSVASQF